MKGFRRFFLFIPGPDCLSDFPILTNGTDLEAVSRPDLGSANSTDVVASSAEINSTDINFGSTDSDTDSRHAKANRTVPDRDSAYTEAGSSNGNLDTIDTDGGWGPDYDSYHYEVDSTDPGGVDSADSDEAITEENVPTTGDATTWPENLVFFASGTVIHCPHFVHN